MSVHRSSVKHQGKKKMLITGVSGLLGSNLAYYFRDEYDVMGLYNAHPVTIERVNIERFDLLSAASAVSLVDRFTPDVVIHCASLTNIDYCETHRDLTRQVNVLGTRLIVKSLNNKPVKFVYISTDSVYGGKSIRNRETDPVDPPNYYGITKYEGEQEVLKIRNALIIRTNIFGWNVQEKQSIAEWMLGELSAGRPIKGFQDVVFSSLYTFDLAKILARALEKDLAGIYNMASCTALSKYKFALGLADLFGLDKSLIIPASVSDSPLIAPRAKYLTLDVEKFVRDVGSEPPTVMESLEAFRRDFCNGLPRRLKGVWHTTVLYPQLDHLPYGRQCIDEQDIAAVSQVLRSPNLTRGPEVPKFESALADVVAAKYVTAVNSGSSALHLACLVAGVGPGDEVITSPNSFVASANCAVYCQGTPIFADIDPKTYNISPCEIEKKISARTKVVIPVHFAGQRCDMAAIRDIVSTAEKKWGNKIFIIEDGAHALGASYRGRSVGSCLYSDMTIMSFHPVKHITTGEGGAISTNDSLLDQQLKLLRSHGIVSVPAEAAGESPPWYYEQVALGFNYRITDIQCALGRSQLSKLGAFIQRRREIAVRYNAFFEGIAGIRTPCETPSGTMSYHLYVLLIEFEGMGLRRALIMTELKGMGIQTQVHYIPIHTQPYFQKMFGTKWSDCPVAEYYYQRCLSLPLFPAMTNQDIKFVGSTILKILGKHHGI